MRVIGGGLKYLIWSPPCDHSPRVCDPAAFLPALEASRLALVIHLDGTGGF